MSKYTIQQRIAMVNQMMQPDFAAKALSEYWEARNADLQDYMAAVSDLTDYVIELDDGDYTVEAIRNAARQQAVHIFNAKGWALTGTMQIANGTISLLDFMVESALDDDTQVTVLNGLGVASANMSIHDVGQQIVDDLASSIATSAFLRHLDDATSVADKLIAFENDITTQLSTEAFECNASVAYFKRLLQTKPSVISGLKHVSTALNLDAQADDLSDATPINSEFASYTGASPVGPLNFDSFGNAVGTVCKVGAAVVSSAINAIGQGLNWLFGWVGDKISQTFVDPVDLKVMNSKGDGTVQGWAWNVPRYHTVPEAPFWGHVDELALTDDQKSKIIAKWNAHPYHCYKAFWGVYQTEVRLKDLTWEPNPLDPDDPTGPRDGSKVYFTPDGMVNDPYGKSKISFSPCVFNVRELESIAASYYGNASSSWVIGQDFVENVIQPFIQGGLWSKVDDLSETEMARALVWARYFDQAINAFIKYGDDIPISRPSTYIPDGTTVTNAQFVEYCSGYRYWKDSGNWQRPSGLGEDIGDGLVFLAMYQNLLRTLNPMDWPFVAYSSSSDNSITPTWKIVTDESNRKAANDFLTTAIIVAAVVAVSVVAGTVCKKIARKAAWKREQTLATVQNKMWKGESLTKKEMRQYQRAVKKGGVSSMFNRAQGAQNIDSVDPGAIGDRISEIISGSPL